MAPVKSVPQVMHFSWGAQNTERHTEQTKPASMALTWQKHVPLNDRPFASGSSMSSLVGVLAEKQHVRCCIRAAGFFACT